MKRIIVISLLFIISCTAPVQKVDAPLFFEAPSDLTVLEQFFKTTEDDAAKALEVVEKYKLIQNLTHLKLMNTGGRKYYLLERENITEMINSVTKGVYLDYILINSIGEIIYTKSNDDIFGSNVKTGFNDTPLEKCFLRRNGIHFEDVSLLTHSSTILGLYISIPVYIENSYHGLLILVVDVTSINRLFDESTDIMSREGLIRVASDRKRILSPYIAFNEIDMTSLDRDRNWTAYAADVRTEYSVFQHKTISWIIAKKRM